MTAQVLAFRHPAGREPWVNKGQVAAYLGRSKRWVELMAREGMPSRMIGGRRAYRLSEVDAWIEERFG
jgi:predicted DNA-binding transcriptional regulator AlpA